MDRTAGAVTPMLRGWRDRDAKPNWGVYIEAAIPDPCAMLSLIGAQSGFEGVWRASYLVMTIRHIRRDRWGIYAAYIRHWRRGALRHCPPL
jgi:hypothetical protein